MNHIIDAGSFGLSNGPVIILRAFVFYSASTFEYCTYILYISGKHQPCIFVLLLKSYK